jgi:hypothetical protein
MIIRESLEPGKVLSYGELRRDGALSGTVYRAMGWGNKWSREGEV